MKQSHLEFWRRYPALFIALSMLAAVTSYLYAHYLFLPFWLAYLLWLKQFDKLLLCLVSLGYIYCLHPKEVTPSQGYFKITALRPYTTAFQKGVHYEGYLYTDGQKFPCTARAQGKKIDARFDYVLEGVFKKTGGHHYTFKKGLWKKAKPNWGLSSLRLTIKQKLKNFLKQVLKEEKSAHFLSALLTADVEDRSLRYEFSQVGLQHILAVSGFHFAALIAFFSFLTPISIADKYKQALMLCIIGAYFIFVGGSPSVQRSALSAALYIAAHCLRRNTSGLNLLGSTLIAELLIHPLAVESLSFQLSYLSCFGILLFYPCIKPYTALLFIEENFLARRLKTALDLTLSVHLAMIPLLLYHFHAIPMLSLIYNLFMPQAISLAFFSLLAALLMQLCFPMFSPALFSFTDWFTKQLLDIVAFAPSALRFTFGALSTPGYLIAFYLFVLLHLTITLRLDKMTHFNGGRSSVG